jgi:hypothetical protein
MRLHLAAVLASSVTAVKYRSRLDHREPVPAAAFTHDLRSSSRRSVNRLQPLRGDPTVVEVEATMSATAYDPSLVVNLPRSSGRRRLDGQEQLESFACTCSPTWSTWPSAATRGNSPSLRAIDVLGPAQGHPTRCTRLQPAARVDLGRPRRRSRASRSRPASPDCGGRCTAL